MVKNSLKNLSYEYYWRTIFSSREDEYEMIKEWRSTIDELIEKYVPEDEDL